MFLAFLNISFVTVASFFSAFFAFLLQIFLSNNLSLEDYGHFIHVFTLITIFLPFVCFGVPQLWLKIYGELGKESIKNFDKFYFNILIILVLVLVFLIFWAKINHFNSNEKNLLFVLSFILISQIFFELSCSVLQIRQNFKKLSFFILIQNLIRLLMLLLIYLFIKNMTVSIVSYCYLISAIIVIFISFFELKDFFNKNKIKISMKRIHLFSFYNCLPIATANFLGMLYLSSNIILLNFLSNKESIAIFNIALTIFYLTLIIPNTIYHKIYLAKFHYWANHDVLKLKKHFFYGSIAMFFLGLFCSLIINLFSDIFILTVFGERFYSSIHLLNILSFALPIVFPSYVIGSILLTKNLILKKIINMTIVAIITPILSYSLFLKYSLTGVSISILIISILLFILNLISLKKNGILF